MLMVRGLAGGQASAQMGQAGAQVSQVAALAHQGGWDEILLVAGPIAVIVGLLLLARKRVGK